MPMLSMDGHVYYPDGLAEALPPVGRVLVEPVVPRRVAERLAEALEAFVYTGGCGAEVVECARGEKRCRWCTADLALAEFRAVFPKAEEA